MSAYEPGNWYWIIKETSGPAWSSASSAYVSSWPEDRLTRIESEAELREVLRNYGLKGPGVDKKDIEVEFARRVSTFVYAGKEFDFVDGKGSDVNVAGAGTLALAAMIAGAQVGNLRWADPNLEFSWVAKDNSSVLMDAHTTLAFAQTAALWKARHVYASRRLKDQATIPADYTSDAHWA
jgi:hypothetical protein